MKANKKERKPHILWVAKHWKRWLRDYGKIDMFVTKKECEEIHVCEAVKIKNFIEDNNTK